MDVRESGQNEESYAGGAFVTGSYIIDSWANLRENPVFKRTLIPSSFRGIYRNPLLRSVFLTAIAVALYRIIPNYSIGFVLTILMVSVFWTILHAIQHFFTWGELTALSVSGNLNHYLSSGLNRGDIALGIIYPAFISHTLSLVMIITWYMIETPAHQNATKILFLVLLFLLIKRMFKPPALFIPDIENYMRKRNPLALYFIALSSFVPTLLWFVLYFLFFIGLAFGLVHLQSITLSTEYLSIAAFILTYLLHRFPANLFYNWRLKRFYSRFDSFEDLFDGYISQQDSGDTGS